MIRRGISQVSALLAGAAVLMVLLGGCASAPKMARSYTPQEKEARLAQAATVGTHHVNLMTRFLDDNPTRRTGGTVFLGDSITEQFPVEQAMAPRNVINRGIGGNMVRHLRTRLDTSVADLQPKEIYLKIGINDLWWGGGTPQTVAEEYEGLLREIRAAAPGAGLFVQSTLPTVGRGEEINAQVRELNESIRAMAPRYGATYIDLWPVMADEAGNLRSSFTRDGVHLTLAGNLAWLNVLLPDDEEYLKAIRNLAPLWRENYPASWPIAAIDPAREGTYGGSRGADQLIVYTPAYGHETTGTNEWGTEVVVVNGRVSGGPRGNDSRIPANGYIVSGHGKAATWINGNLVPGVAVQLHDDRVTVGTPQRRGLYMEFWHACAALDERNAGRREWREALEILRDLRLMAWLSGESADVLARAVIRRIEQLNPERYGQGNSK